MSRSSPPQLVKRFEKPGKAEIWESIQYMDHEAMDILREPAAKGASEAWEAYLSRTKVCSRFISVVQRRCPSPPRRRRQRGSAD